MKKIASILLLYLGTICILNGCTKQTVQNTSNLSVSGEDNAYVESNNQLEGADKGGKMQDHNTDDSKKASRIQASQKGQPDSSDAGKTQPEMKGKITISSFYEVDYLSTAAEQFMKKYPDVTVTINNYKKDATIDDIHDYLTTLNTRIMNGKAEDLFFTFSMPVEKYSHMGIFENLADYIKNTSAWDDQHYFMNVLNAPKTEDEKQYLIPLFAKWSVMQFNYSMLKQHPDLEKKLKKMDHITFSESMEIGKQMMENWDKPNTYLSMEGEQAYMGDLFKEKISQFIDSKTGEVHIDSPEYIKMLEETKETSEKYGLDADGVDFYNMEYYLAIYSDFSTQAAFYELDQNSNTRYTMPIADEKGNISIYSDCCIAMNHASKNQALAWEFIKFLLSDDIQSLPTQVGLPINRSGFQAAARLHFSTYSNYNKEQKGGVTLKKYTALLKEWMELINHCDTIDPNLLNMAAEENYHFFQGKQSAKETAHILQNKMMQYFNE